jgi:hypothetical protein
MDTVPDDDKVTDQSRAEMIQALMQYFPFLVSSEGMPDISTVVAGFPSDMLLWDFSDMSARDLIEWLEFLEVDYSNAAEKIEFLTLFRKALEGIFNDNQAGEDSNLLSPKRPAWMSGIVPDSPRSSRTVPVFSDENGNGEAAKLKKRRSFHAMRLSAMESRAHAESSDSNTRTYGRTSTMKRSMTWSSTNKIEGNSGNMPEKTIPSKVLSTSSSMSIHEAAAEIRRSILVQETGLLPCDELSNGTASREFVYAPEKEERWGDLRVLLQKLLAQSRRLMQLFESKAFPRFMKVEATHCHKLVEDALQKLKQDAAEEEMDRRVEAAFGQLLYGLRNWRDLYKEYANPDHFDWDSGDSDMDDDIEGLSSSPVHIVAAVDLYDLTNSKEDLRPEIRQGVGRKIDAASGEFSSGQFSPFSQSAIPSAESLPRVLVDDDGLGEEGAAPAGAPARALRCSHRLLGAFTSEYFAGSEFVQNCVAFSQRFFISINII